MKRRDILLQRVILYVLNSLLRKLRVDHIRSLGGFGQREQQIRLRVAQEIVCAIAFFGRRKTDFNIVADTADAGVTDALVAKLRTQIGSNGVCTLGERRTHVNLQQEVHTAAQVKTQIHRQSIDRKKPSRRIRHQIQSHDMARILRIGIERLLNHFARTKLLFSLSRIKTHADGILLCALFKEEPVGLEVRVRERSLYLRERLLGDLHRCLAGGNLHRRRLTVKVRQRINEPNNEHDADQNVFPERIAIHRSLSPIASFEGWSPHLRMRGAASRRPLSKRRPDAAEKAAPGLQESRFRPVNRTGNTAFN